MNKFNSVQEAARFAGVATPCSAMDVINALANKIEKIERDTNMLLCAMKTGVDYLTETPEEKEAFDQLQKNAELNKPYEQ